MGGETGEKESGWTVDTLARHFERRFDDLNRLLDERADNAKTAMSAALASADRITAKAELAANDRFDSVNEFRKTLADQTATFMPKAEVVALLNAISDRITRLEERMNLDAGNQAGTSNADAAARVSRQQGIAIVGALIAVVSVAVALILGLNN